MKIGKLPNSILNEIILEPLNNNSVKRQEVLLNPSIGEDCSAINFGGDICLISTDPITGASKDIGKLAVNININDIVASGGEPIGIMVTILLPPSITLEEIKAINSSLYEEAARLNINILGGHTEVTEAVNKVVISCTAIGKAKSLIPTNGAKIGDEIIMTKYTGIEGSAIFANDKEDYLKTLISQDVINKAKQLINDISVLKEGSICAKLGVNAMHDVTEGGVLGGLYELAKGAGLGMEIYGDDIPILEETRIICTALNVDPLRLISSGSMLIACNNSSEVLAELAKNKIKATIIGKIIDKGLYYIKDNNKVELKEQASDQLYIGIKAE